MYVLIAPPFLISIRLLCHFGVDEHHSAVLTVLEIFSHGLFGELVGLQLILVQSTWLCGGEGGGGCWNTAWTHTKEVNIP